MVTAFCFGDFSIMRASFVTHDSQVELYASTYYTYNVQEPIASFLGRNRHSEVAPIMTCELLVTGMNSVFS